MAPTSNERFVLLLMMIGIIALPFSNSLALLIPLAGIVPLLSAEGRIALNTLHHYRCQITTVIAVAIILAHCIHVPIPHTDVWKDAQHLLTLIPIVSIGLLTRKSHCRTLISNTLYLAAWLMAVCQQLTIALRQLPILHQHITIQHPRLYTAIAHASTHHIQARGPFLAIGLLIASLYLLKASKQTAWLHWLNIPLFGFSILTQPERVGYLCLAACLGYLMIRPRPWRSSQWRLIPAQLAMGMLFLAAPNYWTLDQAMSARMATLIHTTAGQPGRTQLNHQESTQLRIDGIRSAWHNIQQRPLWGYGVGTFHPTYPPTAVIDNYRGNIEPSYCLFLLQLGLIGTAALAAVLFALWQSLNENRPHERLLSQGVLFLLCIGACTFPLFYSEIGLALMVAGVGSFLYPAHHDRNNASKLVTSDMEQSRIR